MVTKTRHTSRSQQQHSASIPTLRDSAQSETEDGNYWEERRFVNEAEERMAHSFDKTMITLSAGSLALSITFIHDIAPHPIWIISLIISWSCFILSLIFIILSMLFSQQGLRNLRAYLDNQRCGDLIDNCYSNKAGDWTDRLNWASVATFILGIIFLSVFSIMNLAKEPLMSKERSSAPAAQPVVSPTLKPSPRRLDEGFVAPKPAVKPANSPKQK